MLLAAGQRVQRAQLALRRTCRHLGKALGMAVALRTAPAPGGPTGQAPARRDALQLKATSRCASVPACSCVGLCWLACTGCMFMWLGGRGCI